MPEKSDIFKLQYGNKVRVFVFGISFLISILSQSPKAYAQDTLRIQEICNNFLLNNDQTLRDSIEKFRAKDKALLESSLRKSLGNCLLSALYNLLISPEKKSQKTIYRASKLKEYELLWDREEIKNSSDYSDIIATYFNSLFPDDKKQKLGIYFEINLMSDYPMMKEISFEKIKKVFDEQEWMMYNQIIYDLKNALQALWLESSDEELQEIITTNFQALKDYYYELKMKDEVLRITQNIANNLALENACPELVNSDFEWLMEKTKFTRNIDVSLLEAKDVVSYMWDRSDASFDLSSTIADEQQKQLQEHYNYAIYKSLWILINTGYEPKGSQEFCSSLITVANSFWLDIDTSSYDSYAISIRSNELQNSIGETLARMYKKQSQWYTYDFQNTNDIKIQIIRELEFDPNIHILKNFHSNKILKHRYATTPSWARDRDEEISLWSSMFYKHILEEILEKGSIPDLSFLEK